MRQRDVALSFLAIAAAAFVAPSAQATPLPPRRKPTYRLKRLAVVAQVPIAPRAGTGFAISIDAGVLRALMGGPSVLGSGPNGAKRGSEHFWRSSWHGYALRRAR